MLERLKRLFSTRRHSFESPQRSVSPELRRAAAERHKDRGNIHFAQGEFDASAACYREAIDIDEDYAEAYNNLGLVLQKQGKADEAMALFHAAIRRKPDLAKAHLNCGNVEMAQGRLDAAARFFHTALSFDPKLAEAHSNLGNLLQTQSRLDDALASFQAALRLNPGLVEAHFNLGELLREKGQRQAALASFADGIALKPDFAEAHFSMATTLLSCGQLEEGWRKYKSRFDIVDDNPLRRSFASPEWRGEPLDDKTILVWGDQGVGDEMLFAGLIPDLIARSQRCIVECAHKLVPLFADSFPNAVVVPRLDPAHPATREGIDVQIALADTAAWLRPSLESFPSHDGYLKARPSRCGHWKSRLASLGQGLKIGVSWRSGKVDERRSLHYTTLDQWGPIFSIPGVHFINLQYGECAEELAAARERFGITLHSFEEVDLFDDLAEAAALNLALDLVISAPTATAFLSAALGVPTWMMSYGTPWQLLGIDHMPWFPAMQCFPRKWNQPWEQVIDAIAQALVSRCREP